MAQVLATEIKEDVAVSVDVQHLDNKALESLNGPRDLSWNFLNRDYYPDTPPISLSEGSAEITRPSTPVRPEDEPVVAVLGVGYVGTHLVESFSKLYNVIGFDVSPSRICQLQEQHENDPALQFTTNSTELSRATHFLISVPTLLRPDRTIDSSYLREAIQTVVRVARPGSTVVVESSVAVGMTRELLGPLALEHGLFAGMSPERVDPGRVEPPVQSIPKIISGLDDVIPGSLDAIARIYNTIFDNVVPVSKPEVAEMMKLYENCQRMVCIAYANEMADACTSHGIDPYEVCGAAATKPFGYMPYAPGVGVGGHCIPVNPFYLLSNSQFPLLEAATNSMWSRPSRLADKALEYLRSKALTSVRRPRALVVGMAFKPGQSSLSNSPGLDLARQLSVSQEVDVAWADPLVEQAAIPQIPRLPDSEWKQENLNSFDMIIVALKQHKLDFGVLDTLEGVKVDMWCR